LGEGLDAVVGAALAGHFEPAFVPKAAAALQRLSTEGLGALAPQA
jgi:hypothetical protein